MSDAGLQITVGADVSQAIANVQNFESELKAAQTELNLIGRAIDTAASKGQDISALEDAFQKVSDRIKELKANTQGLSATGLSAVPSQLAAIEQPAQELSNKMTGLGLSTSQTRIAFLDLGRIVTGQGFSLRSLASNFSLLGPAATIGIAAIYGLYEILTKQTDAEKKAAEEAKRLQETLINLQSVSDIDEKATGSEQGNIARVQALAAVILDTNNAYKTRQTALNELRETNKSYFGDLTLEAGSMKLLTDRVNEYSQALITEAIVKGQVEEIAKLSEQLQKQIPILNQLAAARDAQAEATEKAAIAAQKSGDNTIGVGGSSTAIDAQTALDKATNAYLKQNEIVATLKDNIRQYTADLNANILEQAKHRSLNFVKPEDLKTVDSVREKIQAVEKQIDETNKKPLLQRTQISVEANNQNSNLYKLLVDQQQQALVDSAKAAVKNPALAQAYKDLAAEYGKQLNAYQNLNLHTTTIPLADIDDKELQKFHDDSGKQLTEYMTNLPPIKSDIKVDPNLVFQAQSISKLNEEIQKSVSELPTEAFTNIGESIGKAIAKGQNPIEAAGKSILGSVGQVVEDIGKALIQYGTVKEGLDTILSAGIALPGLAAIALGVAAEAIGSLLKSSGASYHAFAAGGIVTGPTLGLVGEAGPEVIFPLDKLNQFIRGANGANTSPVRVVGVLRGRDIAISNARDAKLQGMTS